MDSLAIVSYRNWERHGDQFPAKMETASVNTVLADVDRDGDDMVVHVRNQETRIPCGASSAVLKGQTLSGEAFRGQGGLRTVGCHD